ncbi:MAG TPA: branched-chain amino acid ABC transporter permease [Acidimicrobiales bacterium]|nr:branched-chain amino acid ABC transporter permease [Acidimicrobiales bacterium]
MRQPAFTPAQRLTVGGVGAAAVVVGALSPWATRAFGYPGKMTLSGFPGGARLFCLVLAAVAVLLVLDVPGRRRAGVVGASGLVGVTLFNVLTMGAGETLFSWMLGNDVRDGGGFGAVAWGAWLTLVGAVLLLAALASLPEDRPLPDEWRRLPAPVELLAIAVALGALLWLVVFGLEVEEPSRFVSFLLALAVGAVAVHRVGVFSWLQTLFVRHRTVTLAAAAVAAVAFPFTQGGNAYWIRVFASIGVFAAAAIGLNVVVGLAGLLDLGYVAFFGVGAYVGGLFADAGFTTVHVKLPFIVTLLLGATIAAVFGVVIGAPTLRLRGDYLAIVTLGFGEIFRIIANNYDGLTRGPNGISGIPDLAVGDFDFGAAHELFGIDLPGFANYYFAELVLLAVVILVFTRLNDSRIGRAWVAIREDETAAAAMGVNTIRLKLLAFAIGAFLAGAAGTLNAHVTTSVTPDSYTFLESILLLAAVVLGGMGTVPGALLGSSALFIIPEKLRAFQDKRLLLFGIALILMMRFRPEGIVASRRRQREFREEGGGDATGATPGAPVTVTS